MKSNVFVSFSYEDENIDFVNKIKAKLETWGNAVDYSEKKDRSENSTETIWNSLLSRIHGSSVTIVALTPDLLKRNRRKISSGNDFKDSGWVYKEISASLRDWKNNKINGVLVVYDDSRIAQQPSEISKIIDYNRKNLKRPRSNFMGHIYFDLMDDSYIDVISFSRFAQAPSHFISKAKEKREKSELYNIKYDFHN